MRLAQLAERDPGAAIHIMHRGFLARRHDAACHAEGAGSGERLVGVARVHVETRQRQAQVGFARCPQAAVALHQLQPVQVMAQGAVMLAQDVVDRAIRELGARIELLVAELAVLRIQALQQRHRGGRVVVVEELVDAPEAGQRHVHRVVPGAGQPDDLFVHRIGIGQRAAVAMGAPQQAQITDPQCGGDGVRQAGRFLDQQGTRCRIAFFRHPRQFVQARTGRLGAAGRGRPPCAGRRHPQCPCQHKRRSSAAPDAHRHAGRQRGGHCRSAGAREKVD